MALIPARKALTLDLPPSCVAFCPSRPQFFVVGTYFLHPKEQQRAGSNISDAGHDSILHDGTQVRSGSLILFRLGDDDSICAVDATRRQAGDVLAVATSTGRLVFYRLDARGEGALVFAASKAVADASTLVLALAWHPRRAHVIGFTLSDGCVCLCESTEGELWSDEAVVYQTTIQRHELEAWTLAFSAPGSTNVLSGGDDGVLQYSTINEQNERTVQWHDRKLHNAGVTAILPLTAELVVTGSYDDCIRLIHSPPGKKRRVLAELNLDGGVWRLKTLHSTRLPCKEGAEPEITSLVILASCMHAGARVVRLCKGDSDDGAWEFEVLARFEAHASMNYGADFQPGGLDLARRVVSISFYDKLLCLWRAEEFT